MHYVRHGLEDREVSPGHRGLFTTVMIPRGEVVAVWGGEIRTYEEVVRLSPRQRMTTMQVEDNLFIVTNSTGDPSGPDFVNHSCRPNCGLDGQIVLRAMRDIQAGEEITCDYAISESTDIHEFECHCGEESCRRFLRADDWMRPEIYEQFQGWMSPYLERKLRGLRGGGVA